MTEPRTRKRRPGPLPVVTTAVATFLAVFVLLAAQLRAGHDPALGAGVAVNGGKQSSSGAIVTRTSGGGASQPAGSAGGSSHTQAPIMTHTSGGGGEEDD